MRVSNGDNEMWIYSLLPTKSHSILMTMKSFACLFYSDGSGRFLLSRRGLKPMVKLTAAIFSSACYDSCFQLPYKRSSVEMNNGRFIPNRSRGKISITMLKIKLSTESNEDAVAFWNFKMVGFCAWNVRCSEWRSLFCPLAKNKSLHILLSAKSTREAGESLIFNWH